jgi:hypothetical protein
MKLWPKRHRTTQSLPLSTRLTLEAMEAREVPAVIADPFVAVPTYGNGGDSTVHLVNAIDGTSQLGAIDPFPGFHGPLSVAVGDVNGDGANDVIVAAQGASGLVAVIDGATGRELGPVALFPGFNGPVSVGTADVTGNGYADVLVAAGAPGIPVAAIDVRQGAVVASFNAAPGLSGPVAVSGADLTGTGHAEILVGVTVPGLGGAVGVFGPSGALQGGVLAYPGYMGSFTVAGGDVTGNGIGDIVVAAGPGSPGGEVEVFRGTDFALLGAFQPYAPNVTNGVNVQLANVNQYQLPGVPQNSALDIVTTLQGGGNPQLATYAGPAGHIVAVPSVDDFTSNLADYGFLAGGVDLSNVLNLSGLGGITL